MASPAGVQTPSTARADRLRRPLDSPFPSPSPAGGSSGRSSAAASHHGLSERHLDEIQTVFRIFDPDLSGYLDVNALEAMALALGFRMTRAEVAGMVEMLWEERHPDGEAAADERRKIDLSMATEILAKRGYARRNEEDEMRMYFRIFDGGNKGHITVEDLKRVQDEVMEAEKEMGLGSAGGIVGGGAVGDMTLKAMIDQFDSKGDGVVDYEEFRKVLWPVLSSSSASS